MSVSPDASWTVSGIPSAPLRRFSVDEYHCMIDAGVFGPDDRVELLNGLIIQMSPHNPPHDTCVGLSEDALRSRLPSDWILRVQASITLSQGEPEPNIAIVRGTGGSIFENTPSHLTSASSWRSRTRPCNWIAPRNQRCTPASA
jgi:Uma2 family endonuclease